MPTNQISVLVHSRLIACEEAVDKGGDPPPVTLTPEQQAYVDNLLKKTKEDATKASKEVLGEVEALKTKLRMTTKEREELDASIQSLVAKVRTKEEQDAINAEVARKKHLSELEDLSKERDVWKNRFTDATIKTSIIQACTVPEHQAINPSTVIAILGPQTRLEQEIDADGKPTGNLVPMILFNTKGKDGNPVKLDLPVKDAVKQMSDMDEFAHLFKGRGTGGFGGDNAHKRDEKVDLAVLAKDLEKYKEYRKNHPNLFPN